MNIKQAVERMKTAIENSPRNDYIAEFHVQVLKYADVLKDSTGREFCEAMKISPSFATEFLKMRKIAPRLRKAGLDPAKLESGAVGAARPPAAQRGRTNQ